MVLTPGSIPGMVQLLLTLKHKHMKELEIFTEDGIVLVKQTERGIELHIPRNWRGYKVSKFLAMHEDKIAPLRQELNMPEELIQNCIGRLAKFQKRGDTYNPWTRSTPPAKFPGKRKGYAVSLTHNIKPDGVNQNREWLRGFLIRHSLKLKLEDMYLGVWQGKDKDTGKTFTCIDLVKVISDREDAVETGRLRKQEAIHDLDKCYDVYLKDEPFILEI